MTFDPATLDHWTRQALSPQLTEGDKAIRERFVEEYLFDLDATAAMVRCGFMSAFAEEYAKKYMAEPYVQQRIRQIQTELPKSEFKEAEDQWILVQLRRIAGDSNARHSARVQALAHLARLRGMDPAIKLKQDVTTTEAVQFYIPDNGR